MTEGESYDTRIAPVVRPGVDDDLTREGLDAE